MKISKRTWIILAVGILAIIASLASLYMEKEAEIADLEESLDEPVRQPRRAKKEKEPEEKDTVPATFELITENPEDHEPGQE